MTTQRQTVYTLLEQAGPRGVCATRFLYLRIPRAAARVSELRGEGFVIHTRTCRHIAHRHQTRQIEYVLVPAGVDATIPMC